MSTVQNSTWAVDRRSAENETGSKLQRAGEFVMRYALAAIFLWIGLLKFTAYEAKNIEDLVANSPVFSWAYQWLGLQTLSNVIGVIEITIGVLIAMRAFSPKASLVGALGAAITFLITLSFLLTTPGVWEAGYGFPFPSALPGQFLLKDLVLLGVSIWIAGESMVAAARLERRRTGSEIERSSRVA